MSSSSRPCIGINGHLLSRSHGYRSAGVSGYIRRLLNHLPAAAPDLQLLAFISEKAGPALSAVPGVGTGDSAPPHNLLIRTSRWDTTHPLRRILWEQVALPVVGRQLGIQLLHATVNVSPWVLSCPTVVTVHDLSFVRHPEAFPPLQRLYLRTQARRSIQGARRVIAVSQATARDVTDYLGVPASRIDVVYNGVDPAFSPAPPKEVEAFRHGKKLPERFVLHLGTLEPRKNLVRLVQAFGRARDGLRNEDDTRLVLAGGKGWDYEPIFQEVSRLNLEAYVIFPGYVPENELLWWYRAATAFAYPSLWEGFGLPVLEAMACGTPTVTSKASSLPEVAGDGALLVDPFSVEELAEALIQVLGSRETAQRLREAGMKQASRFSWQQTGQQTAAVYRRALNQEPI